MDLSRVFAFFRHSFYGGLLRVYYLFIELFFDVIYVQYSVYSKNLSLQNRNFGDDLNIILVSLISGKKVVPFKFSTIGKIKNENKYMCIGSVMSMFDLSKTYIWGTGVLSNMHEIKNIPSRVFAVRGPLTRQYLLNRNIECPEVYGDPALLMSKFYFPNISKKYTIGIIAHYLDHDNNFLKLLLNRYSKKIIFIDVSNYGNWKIYIDKLLSCEFVLSSSLHGLIISDAYNVPNYWCEFDFEMDENGFKFRDYFLSVGKEPYSPLKINREFLLEELLEYKMKWLPLDIDLDLLLSCCPFNNN